MIINIRDKNLIKNYHICFHYKRNVHSFPSSSSTIPIYRTNFFPSFFFWKSTLNNSAFSAFLTTLLRIIFSRNSGFLIWIAMNHRKMAQTTSKLYFQYRRSFKIASFVLTRRLTSDNTPPFIVASFLIRNVCSWNSTIRATLEKHIKKIEKNFSTSGRRFHSF